MKPRLVLLTEMKKQGFNSGVVAKEIEISPSFMSQIVTGYKNPSLETALKIAGFLGKTVEELFGDEISESDIDDTGTGG